VSIGVDDGMAWIDGSVPSREAREALTEVVGAVDGVNIVVNRVAVAGSESTPLRTRVNRPSEWPRSAIASS